LTERTTRPMAERLSKRYFCPACGAPAKQMPGSMAANGKPWWAPSCAHAVVLARMGPKRRAEVVAAFEQREEARRRYIASCAGEPVA
jgi:hypothetical protein